MIVPTLRQIYKQNFPHHYTVSSDSAILLNIPIYSTAIFMQQPCRACVRTLSCTLHKSKECCCTVAYPAGMLWGYGIPIKISKCFRRDLTQTDSPLPKRQGVQEEEAWKQDWQKLASGHDCGKDEGTKSLDSVADEQSTCVFRHTFINLYRDLVDRETCAQE